MSAGRTTNMRSGATSMPPTTTTANGFWTCSPPFAGNIEIADEMLAIAVAAGARERCGGQWHVRRGGCLKIGTDNTPR